MTTSSVKSRKNLNMAYGPVYLSSESKSDGNGPLQILFINNYPMDVAYRRWVENDLPGQHLWGVTDLGKFGISVFIPSHSEHYLFHLKWPKKALRIITLIVHLIQQIRACFLFSKYDLIYSACGWNVFMLSILRQIGFLKKPIVAIYHHPIKRGFISQLVLRGVDKLLFISKSVCEDFQKKFDIPKSKLHVLSWGLDEVFYTKHVTTVKTTDRMIISAGKTNRDYSTLSKAFRDIDCNLKIYCTGNMAPDRAEISENVKVIFTHPLLEAIPYKQLLQEYKSAYAIAVPLIDSHRLIGLNGLLDALAVGKPLIMTKNIHIDMDIEAEGVGLWVAPGDAQGWKKAIEYLLSNPKLAESMGKRGLELASTKCSIRSFAKDLADILMSTCSNRQSVVVV